jgi:hypothetical protein
VRFLAAVLFFSFSCFSYSNDREIQRALIQRDQQSAEFAARGAEARRALDTLHSNQLRDAGQPLNPDPVIARELLPYERQTMARERMVLPPIDQPAMKSGSEPDFKPLPLPGSGGPPGIAVPISAPSIGG